MSSHRNVKATICVITPFVTAAELQVVPGNAETPDVVDFATGHPQLSTPSALNAIYLKG